MKTRRWSHLLWTVFTVLSFIACQDWGEMDPPAGNQTYPVLERITNINFEEGDFDPSSFNYYAYEGGEVALVEESEDELYGQVLHLPNGYARIFNPLNQVKVQNGVSLTFMLKQAQQLDAETGEPSENDLLGALFSFQNANGTQRMFLTANGWLCYDALDGTYEANHPETEFKTGMIENDGLWHYVALKVRNDGYEVFVDGKKKVEKTETKFDFSKIVQFMASSPYLYIGYGADEPTKEMWMDDLRIYRNQITAKEVADYRKPVSGGSEDFVYPIATQITIGTADCTAPWWTAFSDYYTMPANSNLRLEFTNHTSGNENWNNWNLCLATEAERNGEGYAEYFVLRADLFGWGDSNYNPDNIANEGYGDWDQFKKDMEGAKVAIDIERKANEVLVTAIATCNEGTTQTGGKTYKMTYKQACGEGTQNINAFLVCENSYLEMDTEHTIYYTPFAITKNNLGNPDCSTGWWSDFSDYFTIKPDACYNINFTNHTSGLENWHNWILVLSTNAERGGEGYEEYFVLRADLFGWGNASYDASKITNEGYGDWDKFKKDMEGAEVNMTISRIGNLVKVSAIATCLDGSIYKEFYQQECGEGTQEINAFLLGEGAYLEIHDAQSITPAFR